MSDSFGVHSDIIQIHRNLLQHMEYHVTISGSRRERKYMNTLNTSIYGTGQGSGNSPHIWTMLSSILLHIMNENANRATYPKLDNTEKRVTSTAYVDDVNAHHNTQANTTINMMKSMMEDYKRWKMLLEASGGKLEVEKCTYYAVDWNFSRGGKPAMQEYGTIQEQESFRESHVQRISITESHKSLGHFISPKESRRMQITQIRELCNKFNGILQQDSLSPKEYKALYKSVFTPTRSS